MPYQIKGKCIYRVKRDGSLVKKGCSSTVAQAKKYMQVLNMRHAGVPEKRSS
jgi:hypothetical protein